MVVNVFVIIICIALIKSLIVIIIWGLTSEAPRHVIYKIQNENSLHFYYQLEAKVYDGLVLHHNLRALFITTVLDQKVDFNSHVRQVYEGGHASHHKNNTQRTTSIDSFVEI